jgi:hypothetical protein
MTIPTTTPGLFVRARTWISIAFALLALMLVAFAPSPADAAKGGKPKCVKTTHNAGNVTQTVYVKNNCPRATVSFVVHRTGPDSPCLHVSPGHTRIYKWANGLDYQGTTYGCD